eukprot:176619-Pleurochrysis_carterae.AAC.2
MRSRAPARAIPGEAPPREAAAAAAWVARASCRRNRRPPEQRGHEAGAIGAGSGLAKLFSSPPLVSLANGVV